MKMTIGEIAKEFGVFRQAVEYQIAEGHLKTTKEHRHAEAGPLKVRVIERADVLALRKRGVLKARGPNKKKASKKTTKKPTKKK